MATNETDFDPTPAAALILSPEPIPDPTQLPPPAYDATQTATHQSTDNSTITDKSQAVDLVLDNYEKIDYHWFYCKYLQDKIVWIPFSYKDSKNLESYYNTNRENILELRTTQTGDESVHIVAVQGGRFDSDLVTLKKRSVYWDDKDTEIRRCLWFYKESNEQRFVPYNEEYCEFLEKHYERILTSNSFHEQIKHPKHPDETFIFHSTKIMLHFVQSSMIDEFGNLNSDAQRPRIIKRGITEIVEKVEADETDQIDHLCFIVHGIGEGCDMRFRPIVDCVDDFRDISEFIILNYFKSSRDSSKVNRIEFLPISWHDDLHADQFGSDNRLQPITLKWIPKLRKFANTTISDVLFYTSPIYCQMIINKVGSELNRLHKKFCERNKSFTGNVSLIGHSLGSLILFDLLTHQVDAQQMSQVSQQKQGNKLLDMTDFLTSLGLQEYIEQFEKEKLNGESLLLLNEADLQAIGVPLGPRRLLLKAITSYTAKKEREHLDGLIKSNLSNFRSKKPEEQQQRRQEAGESKFDLDYEYGLAGTGQLLIRYPQIDFNVEHFFALGSPIGMFLTVRGVDNLSDDFKLPTCKGFFNIFHPYDPIAYRLEPLIKPDIQVEPVMLPHHLGRKRMHLELREGLAKVGGDLKQKMMEKLKFTWSSLQDFAKAHKTETELSTEPQVSVKVDVDGEEKTSATGTAVISDEFVVDEGAEQPISPTSQDELNIRVGNLNHNGRRIDYVLQERPIESFNEYLFALAAHGSYWSSEDTLLLIVKEVYSNQAIIPDALQQPTGIAAFEQHSMSIAQAAASTLTSTFSMFRSSFFAGSNSSTQSKNS